MASQRRHRGAKRRGGGRVSAPSARDERSAWRGHASRERRARRSGLAVALVVALLSVIWIWRRPPEATASSAYAQTPDCTTRALPSTYADLASLLKQCPKHCAARLASSRMESNRRSKLQVLSPNWSHSSDPLLAHSVDGLPAAERDACLSVHRALSELLAEEAKATGEVRHLIRSLDHLAWISEHGIDEMAATMTKIGPLLSWKRGSTRNDPMGSPGLAAALNDGSAQMLSNDPPIITVENFISESDAQELKLWHERQELELPPPPLCVASIEWARRAWPREALGTPVVRGPQRQICFDAATRARLLGERYVKSLTVYDSQRTTRLPFSNASEPGAFDRLEASLRRFGLHDSHALATNFLMYPSQVGYGNHTDCKLGKPEKSPMGGNAGREWTAIVYFSDGGGNTSFLELGFGVKPAVGRALIFRSIDAQQNCDQRTNHRASEGPGEKHLVQRWYTVDETPDRRTAVLNPLPAAMHAKGLQWSAFVRTVACTDPIEDVKAGLGVRRCRTTPVQYGYSPA